MSDANDAPAPMTVTYRGFGAPVTRVFVCWLGVPMQRAFFDTEAEAVAFIDEVVKDTNNLYKKAEYSLRIESVEATPAADVRTPGLP